MLLLLSCFLPNTVQASTPLETWRNDAAQIRILTENDPTLAYQQAQILQANLPTDAPPSDQANMLNLLARIETYLALTESSVQHTQLALDLATKHGDRVEQAKAYLTTVLNTINQGKIELSSAAATRSLELLDGINRPDLLGEAMLRMAMMYRRHGDFERSVTMSMQTMEMAKLSNNPLALTYADFGLAISHDQSSRFVDAYEHYLQMRSHAQAAHSKLLEAQSLQGMAGITASLGDQASSERLIREAITMFRALRVPFSLSSSLYTLAQDLHKQGRHAQAIELLDEAAAAYAQHPNPIGLWFMLSARSVNMQALKRVTEARNDAQRAYSLAKQINFPFYIGESTKRLAALAAASGAYNQAYQLAIEAADLTETARTDKASSRMIELAQRYETESKQRQINQLTHDNEQQALQIHQNELQHRWLWTLIGGGFLLMTGVGYFILHLRRSNRKLEALNHEVHQSKDQLQATFDAIPDLLFILGLDGRYYEIHHPHSDLLVAPAESLMGKTVSEVMPVDAAEICMSALQEAHEKGYSTGKQLQLTLPHGTFWFELSIARKKMPAGEDPRFIGLSRDITERKRMEHELQETQHLLRQLAIRSESAREDERKHIRRELHDELGQYLLALRLGVSVIDMQFGTSIPALQEKTQRLVEMVDATIKVVRNVVTSLRPTALDMGIVSALEWLVDDYSEKTPIQFELQVTEEDLPMHDLRDTAIFRIVQESLTNVVRHAHATQVEISLQRTRNGYFLEVRDNGTGFDPTLVKEKSFGLLGIRERALMLQGEFTLASAPGQGTSIQLRIPATSKPQTTLHES